MNNKLLPMYKWTGGKRKEIKIFEDFFPDFVKNNSKYTFVEPFFGGGAVFWYLQNNNKNVINDIDKELTNFLSQIKTNFETLKSMTEEASLYIKDISDKERQNVVSIKEAKELRGKIYYEWRNKDKKNGLSKLNDIERAFRFYIVNQLSFNGMRRFNKNGEFNIPYGNYKSFNFNISEEHVNLLNKTDIRSTDYKLIMDENDKENTFIFIDPPYTREFKEYSHDNVFGEEKQIELFNTFKNLKNAKAMIIINKDDFTYNLYKEFIKDEYDLKYGTNIKNRGDNSVKHLIITNY